MLNIAWYKESLRSRSNCRLTRRALLAAQAGRTVFWEKIFWKTTRKMLALNNVELSLLFLHGIVQMILREQKLSKVGYY